MVEKVVLSSHGVVLIQSDIRIPISLIHMCVLKILLCFPNRFQNNMLSIFSYFYIITCITNVFVLGYYLNIKKTKNRTLFFKAFGNSIP